MGPTTPPNEPGLQQSLRLYRPRHVCDGSIIVYNPSKIARYAYNVGDRATVVAAVGALKRRCAGHKGLIEVLEPSHVPASFTNQTGETPSNQTVIHHKGRPPHEVLADAASDAKAGRPRWGQAGWTSLLLLPTDVIDGRYDGPWSKLLRKAASFSTSLGIPTTISSFSYERNRGADLRGYAPTVCLRVRSKVSFEQLLPASSKTGRPQLPAGGQHAAPACRSQSDGSMQEGAQPLLLERSMDIVFLF